MQADVLSMEACRYESMKADIVDMASEPDLRRMSDLFLMYNIVRNDFCLKVNVLFFSLTNQIA